METKRPATHGVMESVLYTDDLAKSAAFYREVLGFPQIAGDDERFVVLDSGAGRALLLFRRGATLESVTLPAGIIPPHDGSGPHHIGFAIATADYEPWKQALEKAGVAIESETHWSRGGRSLYFRDPDRHLVELLTPGIWPIY